MADTYTDAFGNVFPLNPYGQPQGYWENNKYIFPKFGAQKAAEVPAVEPVEPVEQPTNPYLVPWRKRPTPFQPDDPAEEWNPPPMTGIDEAMAVRNALLSPGGIAAQGVVPGVGGLFGSLAQMGANDQVAKMLGVDQSWTDTLGGMFGFGNAVSALQTLADAGFGLTDAHFRQDDGSLTPAGGIQTRPAGDPYGSPFGEFGGGDQYDIDYGWRSGSDTDPMAPGGDAFNNIANAFGLAQGYDSGLTGSWDIDHVPSGYDHSTVGYEGSAYGATSDVWGDDEDYTNGDDPAYM